MLPEGISLNASTGLLSGVYTGLTGGFGADITVSNIFGSAMQFVSFSLEPLNAPVVTSVAIVPVFKQGIAFEYQITADNYPSSFEVENLPLGLSLSSVTGLISGVPLVDDLNMTVKALNASGQGLKVVTMDNISPVDLISISAEDIDRISFMIRYTLNTPNDNVGVVRVEFFKNGVYYVYTNYDNGTWGGTPGRLIQGLTPGTTSNWKARVQDAQGNYSGFSNEIVVTTLS